MRKLYEPDTYSHLFIRLSRWNGPSLELVNIQFDLRGRPRFVMNLGVVPEKGVDYCGQKYSQEAADIAHLSQKARLYASNRFFMRWFGIPFFRIPALRNPSLDKIVKQAVDLFPQAEAWLRDDTVGSNIRVQLTSSRNQSVW